MLFVLFPFHKKKKDGTYDTKSNRKNSHLSSCVYSVYQKAKIELYSVDGDKLDFTRDMPVN